MSNAEIMPETPLPSTPNESETPHVADDSATTELPAVPVDSTPETPITAPASQPENPEPVAEPVTAPFPSDQASHDDEPEIFKPLPTWQKPPKATVLPTEPTEPSVASRLWTLFITLLKRDAEIVGKWFSTSADFNKTLIQWQENIEKNDMTVFLTTMFLLLICLLLVGIANTLGGR